MNGEVWNNNKKNKLKIKKRFFLLNIKNIGINFNIVR